MAQMKRQTIIYIFVLILGIAGCTQKTNEQADQKAEIPISTLDGAAEIEFSSNVKDLGNISAGERIITFFRYENTGDAPLLISSIKAGCGCTVPKWSEEPLEPGASDDIKIIFDSKGKNGNQNIRITVNSNARNSVVPLIIKAIVTENQ